VKQRFAVTFTNVPTGVSVALPRYAEVTKVAGAAAPIAAGTSYANKIYARLLVTSYLTAGGAETRLSFRLIGLLTCPVTLLLPPILLVLRPYRCPLPLFSLRLML